MRKNSYLLSAIFLLQLTGSLAYAQVTKSVLDQNADQAQGNYAATNLNYLGSGSLGMMQSAWKDPMQHMGEGQSRPGYTKYYWTPEMVLPIRVREGMYTLVNFPSWEVVENVYLGDGQSFTAEIQGPSSLMVYPEASQFVGVDTNMIVFGRSGNKYVFYVQSETINTDRITNAIIDIEVVKKKQSAANGSAGGCGGGYASGGSNYSQDGTSAASTYTRDLQKEDWIEKIPVDPTKFRFDIEVYVPNPDDIVIAPERVWRDNIFTYIDLGEKALTAVQRPIVTLIVERSETPVGFRAAGPNNRLIIVEGMGDMVMRSGKRLVCLKLRRADSDGLENTIYAKTNEWDLQSSYASNPTQGGENSVNNETGRVENVYEGATSNMPSSTNFQGSANGAVGGNGYNTNVINSGQGTSGGMFPAGFFGNTSNNAVGGNSYNPNGVNSGQGASGGMLPAGFSGNTSNNAVGGNGYNTNGANGGQGASGGMFPAGLSGNTSNNVMSGDGKANTANGTQGASANSGGLQSFFDNSSFFNTLPQNAGNTSTTLGQNNMAQIDSLPKVMPISGTPQQSKEVLTGQYDIRAGQAELITPDYNNQGVNVGVTYQADKQSASAISPQAGQTNNANIAQIGASQNNSSPVLIAPRIEDQEKSMISAETEALLKEFRSGKSFNGTNESNISIELGTDENVNNLEKLWNDISKHNSAAIGSYQPFYSVDTAADGQGKELFHLRVGPIKSLEDGDNICSQLGRNGIFCSVVRIQ